MWGNMYSFEYIRRMLATQVHLPKAMLALRVGMGNGEKE